MTPEDARVALAGAGERLRAAEEARAAAMADVARLAREAKGLVPISQIAELGGVTRPTVYKMLEERSQ